ncbi:MAG: hypothetical protein VX278_15525, partial [Myxococcota bacterium]|nr:hypothetical protein [Myxococcota bacterium]
MMCGIIGYIGPSNTSALLLQGLRRLEYRGYDSAGVAIQQDEGFYLKKQIGMVASLEEIMDDVPSGAGIAHTRWATHGGVTVPNAHPHLSHDNQVVLVHNGIIENANQLREKLEKQGIKLQSQTDSEALSQIISNLYAGFGPFGEEMDLGTKDKPLESI